ncbi:putative nuclease HARBI1 [Hydra vulgaris]|uniref:putative nuclease HARBI1 n=1 Tax=Hydra vulgaris TaxID=6087 RepID=UPI001F5F0BB6|nr:putative nuclease HARBI1 [Hydra vulgaris]
MDIPIILATHSHDQMWRETQRVTLDDYNDVECVQKFRLPKKNIRDIVNTLHNDMSPITSRSNSISSEAKVLISLRLLSSGSFQGVIGDTSHVSQPSCSRILHQFCKYFIHHYRYLVKWYESPEEMMEIKRKYFQSYGVIGLLGVIDGTMIQIKGATGADEPAYICRKGYSALNCQVVIDHDGKFRDVIVRSNVERSIGRLKSRWRCLHKSGGALQYTPSTCCKTFFTCVLLENLCHCLGLEFLDDINFEDNKEDNLHDNQTEFSQANQIRLGIERRTEIKNYLFANRRQ